MIYIRLTEQDFIREFTDIRPGAFSNAGLVALYDFLNDSDDWELDVIAICCEFTQYDSPKDAGAVYGMEEDELRDNTLVIDCEDGTVIIQDF